MMFQILCFSLASEQWNLQSYMISESESCSVMSDSLQPHGWYSPWNSPDQNTRVGSGSLLQGIFLTQGLNWGLLNCRWILYQLSMSEAWHDKITSNYNISISARDCYFPMVLLSCLLAVVMFRKLSYSAILEIAWWVILEPNLGHTQGHWEEAGESPLHGGHSSYKNKGVKQREGHPSVSSSGKMPSGLTGSRGLW